MAKAKQARPSARGKAAAKTKPKRSAKPERSAKPKRSTKPKRGPDVPETGRAVSDAMFQKVAFTMLSVEDPMRARAFYEDVLGLARGLASPDGVWTEYDLPAGGCLALFRHPVAAFAKPPGGGSSIALEVKDLDALNERLTAAGVVYTSDIIHGPNCRMSNILDSEGNAIILHELKNKP